MKSKKLIYFPLFLIGISLSIFSCIESTTNIEKEPISVTKEIIHPYVKGNIVYKHNANMFLDRASRFEVAITCEMDKQKLINTIKTFDDTSSVTIDSLLQITEYMKVKLKHSESDFEVINFEDETDGVKKIVTDSSYFGLWQWNVKPLKVHDSLPLPVKVWGNYGGEKISVPIYDAFIYVKSEEPPPTHWSVYALIGLVLFILLTLLYFFRKKKRLVLNLPKEKVEEIRKLIGKSKVKQAIEELSALIPASNPLAKKELTILAARLAKIESGKTMVTISDEKYNLELSKIMERILSMLEG